jgi:sulfite exporter TauE/SafE
MLLAAVSFGLLGSMHCMGMCGGFVGALAINRNSWRAGLFVYQLGRITTYTALGLFAGFIGMGLEETAGARFQTITTKIAGMVMDHEGT